MFRTAVPAPYSRIRCRWLISLLLSTTTSLAFADLKIVELKAGNGIEAKDGDIVRVHYSAWLYDDAAKDKKGTQFATTRQTNRAVAFKLGAKQVIEGWDRGVKGMRLGEIRRLVIPPKLAYADEGFEDTVPPNARLIYEIELIDVVEY